MGEFGSEPVRIVDAAVGKCPSLGRIGDSERTRSPGIGRTERRRDICVGANEAEFVERLAEVGDWLEKNGESIYGTRGGPITPRPWGVTTHNGSRVYVHVLDWPDTVLAVPNPPRPVKSARYFGTQTETASGPSAPGVASTWNWMPPSSKS